MADKRPMPVINAACSMRPQTLKDTCDMCSASKVRCEKQKPVCSRCERLGYPCFFSPARRVRKRRRTQRVSPDGSTEAAENSIEPPSSTLSRDSSAADSVDPSKDTNGGNGADLCTSHCAYLPMLPRDENRMHMQRAVNYEDGGSGRLDSLSMESDHQQTPSSTASESDCAVIAIGLLEELNMTSVARLTSTSPMGGSEIALIDNVFDTASIAIKRVSTMLICPCSEKTEVGLLAATICATLLDTYELILRECTQAEELTSPTLSQGGARAAAAKRGTSSTNGLKFHGDLPKHGSEDKAATMRLLEDFSKVANLVAQYTKRYTRDGEQCSRDLHEALAAAITTKLRRMIDEVTNWVAKI